MRLYKFDYKGTIGNNVMTVPTNSQFLVGISNGYATADVKLFDGDTELTPEEDKIDEYTCFRFETDSTPFRKPYRAEIGQQSFHDEEAYLSDAGNVPDDSELYVTLAIPRSIQLESLVSDGTTTPQTTSLTAYIVNHASDEEGYPADFEYQKSVTLTWDAEKGGFAMSEPIHCTNSGDAFTYTHFRITGISDGYVWGEYYGTLEDAWYNQGTPDDYYYAIPAPVITTFSIDLLIICQKMSIACRDETGLTSTEAVQAVKDSGEFVVKNELGQYTIVPLIEGGGVHTLALTPDNAYETERIIYEVGARTDDDYTTELIVHAPDDMTGIYKFNVAIYCKGDGAYSTGESMLEINTRAGEDSYVTYPVSIPVAGYGSELGFVIQDSVGKIILATITIWAIGENYCTANITGIVNNIPGVEPEP